MSRGRENLRSKISALRFANLGYWTKEDEEAAELALKGEHYQTGEKYARGRVKL